MAKRGRPFSEDPRRNNVLIRMTDDEFERLKQISLGAGINMADYIRKQIGMYDPSRSKKTRR